MRERESVRMCDENSLIWNILASSCCRRQLPFWNRDKGLLSFLATHPTLSPLSGWSVCMWCLLLLLLLLLVQRFHTFIWCPFIFTCAERHTFNTSRSINSRHYFVLWNIFMCSPRIIAVWLTIAHMSADLCVFFLRTLLAAAEHCVLDCIVLLCATHTIYLCCR